MHPKEHQGSHILEFQWQSSLSKYVVKFRFIKIYITSPFETFIVQYKTEASSNNFKIKYHLYTHGYSCKQVPTKKITLRGRIV